MGMFDDLIPSAAPTPAAAPGMFDDLVPPAPASTPDAGPEGMRYAEGLAQKIAQGTTFGFGDEIAAGMGSLFGLGPSMLGTKTYDEILKDVRGREKRFTKANPKTAIAAEVAGALAPGAVGVNFISRAPSLLSAAGRTAAVAAPEGALSAIGRSEGAKSLGDYAAEAGEGAASSALIGAGASLGLGAGARVLGPWINDQARRLYDAGVHLTPGEILGGYAKRIEDTAASVPFLGHLVRARQREGIDSLNIAAVRQALSPDATALRNFHPQTEPGHDAIQMARGILRRRYNAVVPRLRGQFDQQFENESQAISAALPQSVRPQFIDAWRRHVSTVIDPATGAIDGRGFQHALGALRDEGRRLTTSRGSHAYDYDLGQALFELRDSLIQNAERYTPRRTINDFNRIQQAYAGFARVRDASSRVGAEGGVFTPAQLLSSVRSGDQSAGKGAMATGEALLQDLADPAKTVMTRKVSDSGTPERAALITAILAPSVALKSASAAIAPAALYTRAGNAAFRRAATFSPRSRRAIRRALQRSSDLFAPGLAVGYEGNR